MSAKRSSESQSSGSPGTGERIPELHLTVDAGSVVTEVAKLDERTAGLTKTLDERTVGFTKVIERLFDKIDAQGSKTDAQLSKLSDKIDAQGSRIDALGSKVDALGSKVDAQESKIDAQGSRIDALERKIDAQGAEINTIKESISWVKGAFWVGGAMMIVLGSVLWWAVGARINDALGVNQHKAPIEHAAPADSPPHP